MDYTVRAQIMGYYVILGGFTHTSDIILWLSCFVWHELKIMF